MLNLSEIFYAVSEQAMSIKIRNIFSYGFKKFAFVNLNNK